MNKQLCAGCKQPIDLCYYGGDCLEIQAIYREQQKEKLADIDVDELGECAVCGSAIDKHYSVCYSCENGLDEED